MPVSPNGSCKHRGRDRGDVEPYQKIHVIGQVATMSRAHPGTKAHFEPEGFRDRGTNLAPGRHAHAMLDAPIEKKLPACFRPNSPCASLPLCMRAFRPDGQGAIPFALDQLPSRYASHCC